MPWMSPVGLAQGGGACGELVRALDWESNPLGPIASWPPALAATVANLLHTRQPMLLFWGPELIQIYNDSFVPSFGRGKHPTALGQRARECWTDAWPVIGAQIDAVMSRGEPAWHEDALVPIYRNGRMEEVYWTYSYSPAFDDRGEVQGTLVIVTEMTARVLARRRLESIARLGVALAAATSVDAVRAALAQVVTASPADHPFAVLDGERIGIAEHPAAAAQAALGATGEPIAIEPIAASLWPEPIDHVIGWTFGATNRPLVFGLSPRLPFDAGYVSYLAQLVEQVGSAVHRIETTAERVQVMIELEAASRAKDEFLAMLGHELRNPLAPIVTALELMQHKEAGASHERAIIERQVRHVIRLVDDLLDISKITRGLIVLEIRILELAEVVTAAVQASAHLIAQRGHQLDVAVPSGIRVTADEARLVQIVLNLLSNAARYTPPGGQIRVTAEVEGEAAVLRVSDTGSGIEPELLGRVFDLFVQGVRSPDRAEGGLGLGLALVKNLVALHGGAVSAESAGRGRGSVFTVRLPLAPAEPVAAPPAPRKVRAAVDPKRVLVVDDNEDAANLLGEIARMRGHEVAVVHDSASALDMLATFGPQVAVLDIGLPVMDGYQLAELVRSRYPNCRLIALTGYGQDKDRERSLSAGFAAHLVKPVKVDVLLAMLA